MWDEGEAKITAENIRGDWVEGECRWTEGLTECAVNLDSGSRRTMCGCESYK